MKLIDFLKFCSEHHCYSCQLDDELLGCPSLFTAERILEKELDKHQAISTAIMEVLNKEV